MITKDSDLILKISGLEAKVEGQLILKGLNLEVRYGEIHAIMGRNGSGKSTLAKVLAGHPDYEITNGSVDYLGENLLELDPEDRARKGVFLGFQYPIEIPGVSNLEFLRVSANARRANQNKEELDIFDFEELVKEKLDIVKMETSFLERSVNEGFSGGEKKRNELLQMAILEPTISILDETDSGLDIDALRVVSAGVNQMAKANTATILITHYQRLLNEIKPDYVHVMSEGKIIKTGDSNLALELEKSGYEWIDRLKENKKEQ